MSALLLILLQALGPAATSAAAAPRVGETGVASAGARALEPWDGSFSAGLSAVRSLSESGAHDAAVEVAERLVAASALSRRADELQAQGGWNAVAGRALSRAGLALGLAGPPPSVRAEAHFARAVALRRAADAAPEGPERDLRREQAGLAFESARLLAGPGPLRLDATHAMAALQLAAGEEARAQIPEISGAAPPKPPAPSPAAAGAPPAAAPDPLARAKAAYLAARERLIERLRLDWTDGDARADCELVQRRLRELDEHERRREEERQEQEQEQQDPDAQQQPPDARDQDPPKPREPEQDPKQDQEPRPDEQHKPDGEQPPKEPPPPKDAPEMSKEERQKLLERLERIEELQQELQEKLKRLRRVAVEKDW
ncbi:MAG: hypothetical protein JNK02_14460 [Planctomycetes bacterium]|nr:hypothetical protein [Planctomycetota bacterium]